MGPVYSKWARRVAPPAIAAWLLAEGVNYVLQERLRAMLESRRSGRAISDDSGRENPPSSDKGGGSGT